MNQFALRLFVRSIIAEAKDKKSKEEPKKATKKDTKKTEPKKEESKPKSSGKLVDLKKEVAYLKEMSEQLQSTGLTEGTEVTEVEFSNLQKFVNELAKVKQAGADLKAKLEEEITATEAKIQDEKNKIKEMMGLTPDGKKEFKGFAPKNIPPAQQRKMTTPTPAAGGKGNKEYSDSDVNYLTDPYEKVSKKK